MSPKLPSKRTVAIVVEQDVVRRLISHVLKGEGFEVVEFDVPTVMGDDAVLERVDVIVLDAHLRLADSYALCREFSARKASKNARIIMFGSECTSTERLAGFLAGADDFITGPFDYRELLVKIDKPRHRDRGLAEYAT